MYKLKKSNIRIANVLLIVLILLLVPVAVLRMINRPELPWFGVGKYSRPRTHTTLNLATLKHMKMTASSSFGLTPQDLWKLYNLPGKDGGQGQLIAEVIDGSIPTMETDLNGYSKRFGLPQCTVASGCLTIQNQGNSYIPKGDDPAEGILDVEIMHAVAPRAKILLYIMRTDNTSIASGPNNIIKKPGLRSINMSYGFEGNGKRFEALYDDNPNHVAMFAASGDEGYGNITPPSVYPGVIAVGGTVVNGTNETAWAGSGGGLSKLYPEPDYQQSYGIPQAKGDRGNPDVAAVGGTPMSIYEMGRWQGETGTSVSSPIWTGIAALVDKPITNELLYGLAKVEPNSFKDITSGTNGKCGFYCTARPGYDYVTGLGTPRNFVANVNAMSKARAISLKP
ncbi:S53 family peptidase [Dictyobacter vulcani]|nr:S53 family peptidase [Dictyobacter vulcani]